MQEERRRYQTLALATATLIVVCAVYWPLHAAALVWDDKFYLHDRAWLREGSAWLQIAAHGFPDWGIFFRPLGVALFTAETRLFDAAGPPMHLVSLTLHLMNMALVGLIARRLLIANGRDQPMLACIAMVFYGLHPALTESVAWISSQCDLLVTLFTLLGLLANLTISNRIVRTIAIAACFLFAAASKEAAVSFPLLLLIVDWLRPAGPDATSRKVVMQRVREQWPVYTSVLIAGFAYLWMRAWGLGGLAIGSEHAVPFSLAKLQLIAFTYLSYWKLFLWPMTGLSPMHLTQLPLETLDAGLLVLDAGALVVLASTLYLLWRRTSLGGLMATFSAALLPVLHIAPTSFDESIYHERYETMAIAAACVFLPLLVADVIAWRGRRQRLAVFAALPALLWLVLAMVNIRVILPLWADEVRLWKWTLVQNPGSIRARDALLSTYVEQNDVGDAQSLADALMVDGRDCAKCMLNAAFLALLQRDEQRATEALEAAQRAMDQAPPNRALVIGYVLASGNLAELRHEPADAEAAYNGAIEMDPLSPEARMNLAFLQVRQGYLDQARATLGQALALSPPDAQAQRREEFARVVKESEARTQ